MMCRMMYASAPSGTASKKLPANKLATIQQTRRLDSLVRSLDDVRQVEENALHRRDVS